MEKMIKISETDFKKMKIIQSSLDIDLLEQFISSLNDIEEGRVIRVK